MIRGALSGTDGWTRNQWLRGWWMWVGRTYLNFMHDVANVDADSSGETEEDKKDEEEYWKTGRCKVEEEIENLFLCIFRQFRGWARVGHFHFWKQTSNLALLMPRGLSLNIRHNIHSISDTCAIKRASSFLRGSWKLVLTENKHVITNQMERQYQSDGGREVQVQYVHGDNGQHKQSLQYQFLWGNWIIGWFIND